MRMGFPVSHRKQTIGVDSNRHNQRGLQLSRPVVPERVFSTAFSRTFHALGRIGDARRFPQFAEQNPRIASVLIYGTGIRKLRKPTPISEYKVLIYGKPLFRISNFVRLPFRPPQVAISPVPRAPGTRTDVRCGVPTIRAVTVTAHPPVAHRKAAFFDTVFIAASCLMWDIHLRRCAGMLQPAESRSREAQWRTIS